MLYASNSFVPNHKLEDSDVCFLGVPFDSTAFAQGNQRYGPLLIRNALKNTVSYLPDLKIDPFEELKMTDLGDLDWVPGSFEETSKRLKETLEDIEHRNQDVFKVFLGGEHSITLPIIEYLKPKTIIQFDAHLDLSEKFRGNKYAHNTWAYHAKNELDVDIYNIGGRSYTAEEEKLGAIKDSIKQINDIREPVYVTVDMDVFDPSYAPHTGFTEENGLKPNKVFNELDHLFEYDVIGTDICEISSRKIGNRTSSLAAKTINRILANLLE